MTNFGKEQKYYKLKANPFSYNIQTAQE